jgi:hypothetical protein
MKHACIEEYCTGSYWFLAPSSYVLGTRWEARSNHFKLLPWPHPSVSPSSPLSPPAIRIEKHAYLHPYYIHRVMFLKQKEKEVVPDLWRTRNQELPACHLSYPLSQRVHGVMGSGERVSRGRLVIAIGKDGR